MLLILKLLNQFWLLIWKGEETAPITRGKIDVEEFVDICGRNGKENDLLLLQIEISWNKVFHHGLLKKFEVKWNWKQI